MAAAVIVFTRPIGGVVVPAFLRLEVEASALVAAVVWAALSQWPPETSCRQLPLAAPSSWVVSRQAVVAACHQQSPFWFLLNAIAVMAAVQQVAMPPSLENRSQMRAPPFYAWRG